MARYVCVDPCITPTTVVKSVKIPLGGGASLAGSAGLSFVADCNGCKVTSDLLVKLDPMLGALSPFLDTLGCIAAGIKMLKEIPDAILKLDPTKLFDLLSELVGKCKNVLGLSVFPGTIVCDFLRFVDDTLRVIRSALKCFEGLLTHTLALNINALLLLGDINPQIQRNGECLARRIQRNLATVNTRASVLSDLIAALSVVFELLTITGVSFDDIKQAAAGFAAMLSVSPPSAPAEIQEYIQYTLDGIAVFERAINITLSITEPVEALCP